MVIEKGQHQQSAKFSPFMSLKLNEGLFRKKRKVALIEQHFVFLETQLCLKSSLHLQLNA